MNSRYENATKEIELALVSREKQINELLDKIDVLNGEIALKQKELEVFTETCDVKAYKKTKDSIDDCKMQLEMFRKKVDKLSGKYIIPDEKAEAIKNEIYSIQDEIIHEKIGRFTELLEELAEVGDSIINEVDEGNNIIKKYASQIHGFRNKLGMSSKGAVYSSAPAVYRKNTEFVDYVLNKIKSGYFYMLIKSE